MNDPAEPRVDWRAVPTFGVPPRVGHATVRPSAYAVLIDAGGRVAVVHTPRGTFLPGGGIDPGETPQAAIVREVLEECGLRASVGQWIAHAVEFVDSEEESTYFEKHSTFAGARSHGAAVAPLEPDQELAWFAPDVAIARLSPLSHRWAIGIFVASTQPAGDVGD